MNYVIRHHFNLKKIYALFGVNSFSPFRRSDLSVLRTCMLLFRQTMKVNGECGKIILEIFSSFFLKFDGSECYSLLFVLYWITKSWGVWCKRFKVAPPICRFIYSLKKYLNRDKKTLRLNLDIRAGRGVEGKLNPSHNVYW